MTPARLPGTVPGQPRVVQVLYSGLGGHGSVAFSLAAAADLSGGWSNALLFVGVEPVLQEYRRSCSATATPWRYVPITPRLAPLAWPGIFRALKQLRPDAIVLHSVKAILPCALYARSQGIPLVAVEHQTNALKSKAEWWVSREVMKRADAVVVLTDAYRSQLRDALRDLWSEDRVYLIPNGIDTDTFKPSDRSGHGHVVTVGMAARMTHSKRQDLLIDAMNILRAKDGPHAWRLTLAGDGETREALHQRVQALQLEGMVDFPGYLGDDALLRWFGEIDLYAHASSGETLSTSLLQGLATSLPIVGSDVLGINELLTAGGGCGVLAAQSPEAFATALRDLRMEPERRENLRHNARNLAVAMFSRESMYQRYDRLLRRLWQ